MRDEAHVVPFKPAVVMMRVWPSGDVALPEMSAGRRSFVKRKGPGLK